MSHRRYPINFSEYNEHQTLKVPQEAGRSGHVSSVVQSYVLYM